MAEEAVRVRSRCGRPLGAAQRPKAGKAVRIVMSLVGLAAWGWLACNKPPAAPRAGRGAGGREGDFSPAPGRLSALVAEELDAELQLSPTLATWLGDHSSDDRLDDVSLETMRHELIRIDNLLDRVRRENDGADAMSADPAATADAGPEPGGAEATDAERRERRERALERTLLQARIEARRIDLFEWHPHERSPLFYANIIAFGLDSLLEPSLATPSGLRALRGRLSAIPIVCREAQRNLKNPPELWTRRAIELTQMTRDFVAVLLPRMLANLNLTLDPKLPNLQDEVNHLREDAQRSLEEFGTWLSHELLPRSKGDWALPPGRLQARLRAGELLDVPLEVVLERAEFEHREARRRLEELARHLTGIANPGRAVTEAQHLIEEDHPRPDELTHAVESTLERSYELVAAQGFLTLPSTRPQVADMPAYRFGYLQLSQPAPLEADRPAQLLVDPVDPSWKDKKRVSDHLRVLNRTQILLSVAREVMPGRFTRATAQRAVNASLSPLRQRTRSLALLDGWAGYAEELIAQSGGLGAGAVGAPGATIPPGAAGPPGSAGPAASAGLPGQGSERIQILMLRQQLLRLGRLIVALRLHAPPAGSPSANVRLEQAADFFTEQCFLDEYAARREAERATYDPLYGAAALGRLQLLQLRADYQAEHRDDFTAKGFHDALLAQGALPVVALRELLLRHPGPSLRPPPEPAPSAAPDDEK